MAGFGDELIATGLAKGAAARGKRIAFGDNRRILWGPHSAEIFAGNPNIASPGSERDRDIEWINYYKGNRLYNKGHGTHWAWNYQFNPKPGEIYFREDELEFAEHFVSGFVLIEPNIPLNKPQAVNKDWGAERYQEVADRLSGFDIVQFAVGKRRLNGVRTISTPSFRHSMAVLRKAAVVICPEGGLHHGAAAVGVPAVVLFGGFIPPEATGYEMHTNLTGGAKACGRVSKCNHCRAAMDAIPVEEVTEAAVRHMMVSA